ncbi:class I SAM-dependent methyltransferase [Chitinophaga flava]|uniref:Class I SAM-dependent methyltransferase n=1 Tax=Chitinophaga flava TaxID=2259036 RepID=A0A365XVD5_9BACT|nr:class I SAM-dependent methyltransferase [Chitinophaga flava]RBL90319.1 class I SAM-dependent methyltransferase [Chitinophaga flava]
MEEHFQPNKTAMAVGVFDKNARTYQDKFMDIQLYHDTLDLFCQRISRQQANILEIGCGPGNVTRYLLQQRPDFRILATDLAPNMLALARENNPGATFQLMDGREVRSLEQPFDGIVAGFLLPYLSREETTTLISDAAATLNPGGVLYLSTMEDDYARSGIRTSSSGDQLYQYFHEADYLLKAFAENGLQLIDLQRKMYPAHDGSTVTDLILLAGK